MKPTPPRILHIVLLALTPLMGLFAGLLLLLDFPMLVYLALYHPDQFMLYIKMIVNRIVPLSTSLPIVVVLLGLSAFAAFSRYRQQNKAWRVYQERLAQGKGVLPVHLQYPVQLSAPAQAPLSHAKVNQQRSLRDILLVEFGLFWGSLVAYLAWSQSFFRWPPNQLFDQTIIESATGIFLFGSLVNFLWRPKPIVADQTGIFFKRHHIAWSDVQQLLLVPINPGSTPTEHYGIITINERIELEAPFAAHQEAKQEAVRSFIAFVMHQTHLPLQVEQQVLAQRDDLLTKQRHSLQQKYISQMVLGIILLGITLLFGTLLIPNPTYHIITGQLASFSGDHNGITIHLLGDSASYSLSHLGVWPTLPDSLPVEASVTMIVDKNFTANDINIDMLDVQTGNAHWHFIAQGYAEPWYTWVASFTYSMIFGVPALVLLVGSLQYFWQQRRGIVSASALELFPAPEVRTTSQIVTTQTTKRELRRYARQQSIWWGLPPICASMLGFSFLALAGSFGSLVVVLALYASSPIYILLSSTFGLLTILSSIGSVWFFRKWFAIRKANERSTKEIKGVITIWAGMLGSFFDTLIEIFQEDQTYAIYRIQPRDFIIARRTGAEVILIFHPETGFVERIANNPVSSRTHSIETSG